MIVNYCEWWKCSLENVAEWQSERCEECNMHCSNCNYLKLKDADEDEE